MTYCGKEDISQPIQYEPTGCTIYFQFISIINLYMFRVGLVLIIRKYCSVYIVVGICHAFMLTGCWQDRNGTNCCIYRVVPPDDEQQA